MVGIFETNILKECESVNTACSSVNDVSFR